MKKVAPFLAALLPYCYFGALGCMFHLDVDSDVFLFILFAVFLAVGLPVALVYGIFADVRSNFPVKLAWLPADIAVVTFNTVRIMEANQAAADGAMGVGLSIFALIVFLIPYLSSRGMCVISATVICAKQAKSHTVLHTLLHLIPIADIVSAAMIRSKRQCT